VLDGNDRETGVNYPWGSPQIIGLFSIGGVLLALFLWIEIKAKEPIIPLHIFKIRIITFGNIAGFFMSAGMFGAIVYIPLFVQDVIILYMMITGLGMGAIYPTLGTAAQSAVDLKIRGVATSTSQFFRSIGGTIGVSVLGSLLTQRMASG